MSCSPAVTAVGLENQEIPLDPEDLKVRARYNIKGNFLVPSFDELASETHYNGIIVGCCALIVLAIIIAVYVCQEARGSALCCGSFCAICFSVIGGLMLHDAIKACCYSDTYTVTRDLASEDERGRTSILHEVKTEIVDGRLTAVTPHAVIDKVDRPNVVLAFRRGIVKRYDERVLQWYDADTREEREEELQPGEELVLTTQPSATEPGTVEVRSTAESSGAPVVDRVYSKIAFHMAEVESVANYNDKEEEREARSVEIEGDNGQIIRQNDRVLSLSTTTCPQ